MLMQMQMLPSVAYKINKQHTVGGSLAIGVQSFRAYGLQAFQTGNNGLGIDIQGSEVAVVTGTVKSPTASASTRPATRSPTWEVVSPSTARRGRKSDCRAAAT